MSPSAFATKIVLLAGAGVAFGWLPISRGATSGYVLTDLGVSTYQSSYAAGIDNTGQVLGSFSSTDANGTISGRSFLYAGGSFRELAGLPGREVGAGTAISANGQVVGFAYSEVDIDAQDPHAFLLSGGVMRDLGTLDGGFSLARGVNTAGQVVGHAGVVVNGNTPSHAALFTNGAIRDLGTFVGPQGYSSAAGINASGLVVGTSDYFAAKASYYTAHAFKFQAGTMKDLGTLGGDESFALGVNDAGQIVGGSSIADGGPYHAFRTMGDTLLDLGTLRGGNSTGSAINSAGEIVGTDYFTEGDGDNHAFVYQDGVLSDLNTLIDPTLGWTLRGATGLNDAGQIVGYGDINGQQHAYLLMPVPEPSAVVMLGAGSLLFGAATHRRVRGCLSHRSPRS